MDWQTNDSLRLLLIEDNPGDARLIKDMLAEEASVSVGFTWSDRLNDGIASLAESDVDVLLLDLFLPDSNGLQTVSRLRERAFEIPIVVLTGYDDELLALHAVQEGAQDYLIKGQVDSRSLMRSIRYAIERKRADTERARLLASEQGARAEAERVREQTVAILERISDAFIALDPEWRFTYVNQRAGQLLHKPPSQLVGEGLWDAFPRLVGSAIERGLRRAVAEQARLDLETPYAPLNAWFEIHAYPSQEGTSIYFREITERKRAEQRLARQAELLRGLNERLVLTSVRQQQAEELVAADLRDMRLLHELSARLVTETDRQVFYQEILDAAIALAHADAGTIQILDPATHELVLLAAKGFDRDMTERFQRVDAGSHTSCGVALATGQRMFVDFDVPEEADPDGSLRAHAEAGYLSAQSTPQVSHSGRAVGMFSTHWCTNHRPTERELRFLDLLARQAADWIEDKQAEEERERLQRQLAAERNWLRTVIDRSPIGILLIEDGRGERVTVNRHAAALFGTPITPSGGIDQYRRLLFAADGSPLSHAEQGYIRALTGEVITAEERLIRRSDGQTVPVFVSAGPIKDELGNILGAVVIFDDITAIKELERQREEWISIVTHDLRQPVTVIGGYADLLAMDLPASSEQRREIEHIRTSVRNLSKMIADLRDASQVETTRFTLKREWVDFPFLVHAIVNRSAEIVGKGRVEVTVDDDIPQQWVDPIRIEQVLTNFLINADRYGDPTRPIVVRLHRRGEDAEVSVTNHGPGIAQDDLPHVFSRFYRTRPATQRRRGGLGLGLYIAKGIVEAHGGRIWVESIPNQTTTFHFTVSPQ